MGGQRVADMSEPRQKPTAKTMAEIGSLIAPPAAKSIGRPGDDPIPTFAPPQAPVPPDRASDSYGPLPEYRWERVSNINVDERYQRDRTSERSRGVITRIKEEFSWAKFGVLICFRRKDGKLYVTDGQHRLTGAKELKISHIPILVFVTELDPLRESAETTETAAEAKAFVGMNRDRKNASQLDIYHAAIAAGEPETIELDALIRGAGLSVAKHSNVAYFQPNEIMATPAVKAALNRHGKEVVSAALTAIWEAYCSTTSPERAARGLRIGSPIIQGVCEIYGAYMKDPRFDPDRLIEKLGATDSANWTTAARKWQELHKLKVRESVMAAVLEDYNRGLAEKNRLPKFGPEGRA